MRWLVLLVLLVAGPAWALESAPVSTPRDVASLVSDVDSVAAGKPFHLGLRLKLAPGWHTYWSNPGDAGAPPTLDVSGAEAGAIAYPAPRRLHDGPFTSFAYTGELLLPVTAMARTDGAHITAHATWLVCATVCVPEEARFALALPQGPAAPGAQAALFEANQARMPRASPFPAHVSKEGVLWLEAPGIAVTEASFFPAEAGVLDQGAVPRVTVTADGLRLSLKPLKPLTSHLAGLLQLTDKAGQVENLIVDATPMVLPAEKQGLQAPGLADVLLLAFAGGLILNLMPCVLPILAIKALALARLAGAERGHVRREVAAYTAGVVLAFCAIGGATLLARQAGSAAGWGVQFQSVLFTTATGWLLFAMGLNLSGVFSVGGSLAGAGQGLAARGSFFTGLLAVIVATPCTAPFMGAALAAAFSMPPAAGMAVFVALGLGLAAPYAALALSPRAARLLPRPGAWMETLRQVLAFPMYGAALWLVWVASQQTDQAGLAAVLASFLLVAFAAWLFGRGQSAEHALFPRAASALGLAGALGLLAFVGWSAPPARAASGLAADGSEPFSAARLAELQAAKRPVLVDMSAAWCVTCLVNERLALSPPAVRAAFSSHHVAYLKGDWTRQDEAITAFLRQYDRSGVPLYVYFAPGAAPRVLPQILTQGGILALVDHAG